MWNILRPHLLDQQRVLKEPPRTCRIKLGSHFTPDSSRIFWATDRTMDCRNDAAELGGSEEDLLWRRCLLGRCLTSCFPGNGPLSPWRAINFIDSPDQGLQRKENNSIDVKLHHRLQELCGPQGWPRMLKWNHVLSPRERLRLILSIPPAAKKMKLNNSDCQKTDIMCVWWGESWSPTSP